MKTQKLNAAIDIIETCKSAFEKIGADDMPKILGDALVRLKRDDDKDGVALIENERARQINSEGWTPEHDDTHIYGELALAAACYAVAQDVRDSTDGDEPADFWPRSWDESWWKPTPDDRIKELAKAGALIAAEIDRLSRLEK